ncbi:HAUS augmin-like complex subunit 2 [Cololabis saira]|uniref:HAUS augmin-like complex subunit 2 n=1 Tax=Cololabis saira TaxID=129043 RepID=UPI002AD2E5BC|nr:HAUS augmin-like complex subunit 2 [Cololabis saira]XP_061599390.1 HAUS augmin-like complex subunit 2 [Cololabis saira]
MALTPFAVTPAASLLSRCVSVGAADQEEIDSAFSEPSPAFSSHLWAVEERIRTQKRLHELQLQLELLKVEEQSADVTNAFHLGQKDQKLQILGGHLLNLLKEQRSIRQRLMRPLARTNLPVPSHAHRSVVNSFRLMVDFIGCLEEKLSCAHNQSSTKDCLTLLDTSATLLLMLAKETETLSTRILQWRTLDGSHVTSDTHRPHPPPAAAPGDGF